jgi:2,4-dienoyl-CoA reductase-like NADH-dependent reductase (Old Yellow Enzyme family)
MPHLFEPLKIRDITLRNRIGVSPMCQYSSIDGMATDWHLVHLGSRAIGGAGLIVMEATAVEARGRISPGDSGIYHDEHVVPLQRITTFLKTHGAVAGIQLAHAGRKASRNIPWEKEENVPESRGGWKVIGPSAIPFSDQFQTPVAMSEKDIAHVVEQFARAAARARDAGFEWLELHGAHGYLIHSFLSPLSNQRTDRYGGSFENRTRLLKEIVAAVKKEWPERLPITARLSGTDWTEGGWTLDDTVRLAHELKSLGLDLLDLSSGGNVAQAAIPVGAGYQVPLAETVRRETGILTAAVGMITEPMQADELVRNGRADVVMLARELLRDPYWPLHAAAVVHQKAKAPVPKQYLRAF